MSKFIIAIDPGLVGGIVFGHIDRVGVAVNAHAMPETETDVVDLLRSRIINARNNAADMSFEIVAVMEKVGGYVGGAGQPGSAMFSFGRGAGIIYGCLMYAKVRIEEVTPQKWQKFLSLGHKEHAKATPMVNPAMAKLEAKRVAALNAKYKTEWKNKLKAEAQRLYPEIKVTLKTADALLIYEYAKRLKGF